MESNTHIHQSMCHCMSSYKQFVFDAETKEKLIVTALKTGSLPFSYIPGLPLPHYKQESLLKGSGKFTERRVSEVYTAPWLVTIESVSHPSPWPPPVQQGGGVHFHR